MQVASHGQSICKSWFFHGLQLPIFRLKNIRFLRSFPITETTAALISESGDSYFVFYAGYHPAFFSVNASRTIQLTPDIEHTKRNMHKIRQKNREKLSKNCQNICIYQLFVVILQRKVICSSCRERNLRHVGS